MFQRLRFQPFNRAVACLLLCAGMALLPALAQESVLDPSFGVGLTGRTTVNFDEGGTNADVGKRVLRRADGRLVLVGEVATATGKRLGLARLNANGTLDTSFGNGGTITHDACFDQVHDAVLDAAGRIVVVGETVACAVFAAVSGRVARYLENGQLDAETFGPDGYTRVNFSPGGMAQASRLFAVVALANGSYVVGGSRLSDPASPQFEEAHLALVASTGGVATQLEVAAASISPRRAVAGVPLANNGSAWVIDYHERSSTQLELGGIFKLSSSLTVDTGFGSNGLTDLLSLNPGGAPGCEFRDDAYEATSLVVHGNTLKTFGWVFTGGIYRGWWASLRTNDGAERRYNCHAGMSGMELNAASADPGSAAGRIVVAGACGSLAPDICLHALRPVDPANPDQLESDPNFNLGLRLTVSFPAAAGVEPGGVAYDVLRIGGGKTLVAGSRVWNATGDTDYAVARLGAADLLSDGFEPAP